MATQHSAMNVDTQAQKPQRPEKQKPYFPRPKNKIPKGIPKPMHISKKETELTNDPLWLDSFVIDGETGFVSEEPTKTFNPDAAGYVQLVESEYKAKSDVDKHYAKSVPASAHAYYHHILLWYKIALGAQKHGTASFEQEKLVQFVSGYGSLEIASGAGEYLTGLGDYTDSTGVKHIMVATEPRENGSFGQVRTETHGLYETLPAPAISLQRVAEDLRTSNNKRKSSLNSSNESSMKNTIEKVFAREMGLKKDSVQFLVPKITLKRKLDKYKSTQNIDIATEKKLGRSEQTENSL